MYHGPMTTDVAIVGAGPGGAWAAYSLARRGAKVLLFDPSHPREKPCGGGVTGRALDLVAAVLDPARIPRSVIRSARFVDSSTGLSASVSLEGSSVGHESPLIVASRTAIDHALVEAACQAGAELVTSRV